MPYTVVPARQVKLLLGPCQQAAVTETVSPRANGAVTDTAWGRHWGGQGEGGRQPERDEGMETETTYGRD
jgi:hypothetical protein